MAIMLRRGRDGQVIRKWYGEYKDEHGKRRVLKLGIVVNGEIPASLTEQGDPLFEEGRAAAQKALDKFREEAWIKGSVPQIAQRLIEAKTGIHWVDTFLDDFPKTVMNALPARARGSKWAVRKEKQLVNFAAYAKGQGLNTATQVTGLLAKQYLDLQATQDKETGKCVKAGTLKKLRSILAQAFSRVLPPGGINPFKDIVIDTQEGDQTINRTPLSETEVQKLLAVAQTEDPMAYELIVTALCTGLRCGDVCLLKWTSVDLKENSLTIRTSKTKAEVCLPILPLLRGVLAAREKQKSTSRHVFKEAADLYDKNPAGITYRVKKLFAKAFAVPPAKDKDAKKPLAIPPKLVRLADVLDKVFGAVSKATDITDSKRERMFNVLKLYAEKSSLRRIEQEDSIPKGTASGLLKEAQTISKCGFLPTSGIRNTPGYSIKAAVNDVTRTQRTVGMRAASTRDFHSLRTTFVTLAISSGISTDKLRALTGHATVDIVLRHYFKPKGTDFADELTRSMPSVLTATSRRCIPVKAAKPVKVMPKKVSDLLASIQKKGLNDSELQILRELI
jgi:integrase